MLAQAKEIGEEDGGQRQRRVGDCKVPVAVRGVRVYGIDGFYRGLEGRKEGSGSDAENAKGVFSVPVGETEEAMEAQDRN